MALPLLLCLSLPALANESALREQVYDQSLPLQERIDAMQALTGLEPDPNRTYRVCIWDIFGRSGPIFAAAQDQRRKILQYGINVEMVPYTSESIMVEELKSGTCDAALMSGLRARLFNKYTGTLDSIGGFPERAQMRLALQLMADPRSADRMVSGDYVVMGIAPGGAAHVFVNDRSINTLAKASGKRVVVLDYDPTQARMIAGVGATPVVADIVNAPNMFNTGVVDVLAAPLAGYEVLELHKGLEPNGGIIDLPLTHITMQLIGRAEVVPNELAQFVREAFYQGFDEIISRVTMEEAKVPEKWFIEIPEQDRLEYERMMQQARLQLREEGYYSGDMLTLQRKIRCRADGSREECTHPVE
ncbi:MAG: putative solute-binding protein [Marinobacter sp.]|uniref:putative solute-binding protein n=1 Tax=Marinobacter sp. TaxID=50741 RepID=UPI00299E33EF|nr:putative solute-binding protein [Marinobacter sp.]MDX1755356.1 putative solute-binding protein [Marinobacter sp.]